ncbi:MAG: hypothetical protein HC888_03830 [Candidatus Competibacteraceae bacterium]|nr:hypothetical protein [Candidatus Competibacteraceae bacterium]
MACWRTKGLIRDRWNGLGQIPTRIGHRRRLDDILKELNIPRGIEDIQPERLKLILPPKDGDFFPDLIVYTDGSKMIDDDIEDLYHVGAGWAITKQDEVLDENDFSLPSYIKVYL